jgi:hypothetical protein
MIQQDKLQNAMFSMSRLLAICRSMALFSDNVKSLSAALDIAEYLPRLIAEPEDNTDVFRQNLEDLVRIDGRFGAALESFDRQDLEYPW